MCDGGGGEIDRERGGREEGERERKRGGGWERRKEKERRGRGRNKLWRTTRLAKRVNNWDWT